MVDRQQLVGDLGVVNFFPDLLAYKLRNVVVGFDVGNSVTETSRYRWCAATLP